MHALPVLTFMVLLACVPMAYAAQGPETAVAKVQQAIDTKNLDLLQEHLDVETVSSQAAEWLLTDEKSLESARKNPKARLLLAAVGKEGKAHDAIRGMLVSETNRFVTYGVESGSFAGEAPDEPYSGGLLQKAFAKALRGRKDFSPAKVEELRNDRAIVTTTLSDAGSKKSFPLRMRVHKEDGRWRIKEVLNMEQLSQPKKIE